MRVLALCSMAAVWTASWSQAPRIEPYPPLAKPVPQTREITVSKSDSEKARKLLQLGTGRVPTVNVRAIIFQRIDKHSRAMQQVKVEMSKSGKIHKVVLAPLRYQGYGLVDDGVYTKTYSPDDKKLVIQPSARQYPDDGPFRMRLVDKNYQLRIDRRESVAGRSGLVIEAIPKNEQLETRCYTIDEKTGLLLRLETCREGGKPMLQFEAKMVEFPAEFLEGTFKLEAPMGVNIVNFTEKCVSPEGADTLVRELGFRPVIPDDLPYGFAVQQLQTSNRPGLSAVSVRVTDGLAGATIYQWRHGGDDVPAPAGMMARRSGKLTLMISGDLPDDVKRRILESFAGSARAAVVDECTSWALEPGKGSNRFGDDGCWNDVAYLLLAARPDFPF